MPKSAGLWEVLESSDHLGSRASHSSVVFDNRMFVFGGDYFPGTIEYEDFIAYDFATGVWDVVGNYSEDSTPFRRYDHSLVVYQVSLIIYYFASLYFLFSTDFAETNIHVRRGSQPTFHNCRTLGVRY